MADNEIKNIKVNEVSAIVKEKPKKVYALSSLMRIFFARVIDLLLAAIPNIIVGWTVKTTVGSAGDIAMLLGIQLASVVLFLMIIPSLCKGNSIGKLLLGIRLKRSKGDKKVKWWMIFARESYFLLIPWFLGLIFMIIGTVIFTETNKEGSTSINYGAMIMYQIAYVVYFLWFIFVLISIKMQPEHQSGIDMKFGLFVVYKDPVEVQGKEVLNVEETNIIMTDQPGNLSEDNLKELRQDEKTKYEKSISLDDLDVKVKDKDKKKKDDDTKKIEGDK